MGLFLTRYIRHVFMQKEVKLCSIVLQRPHQMWSPPGPSSRCWRAGQRGRTCPCWAEPPGNPPRWCCGRLQASSSQTVQDTPSWSVHNLEDPKHTHTLNEKSATFSFLSLMALRLFVHSHSAGCWCAKHNETTVSLHLQRCSKPLHTEAPINLVWVLCSTHKQQLTPQNKFTFTLQSCVCFWVFLGNKYFI